MTNLSHIISIYLYGYNLSHIISIYLYGYNIRCIEQFTCLYIVKNKMGYTIITTFQIY